MAVTRFGGDLIIEKYTLRKILITASVICAIGLCFYSLGISIFVCTFAMLVCGLGFSILVPILFREAGRVENISPSLGLALVSTLGYMGLLMGPPMIGFLSDAFDLKIGFGLVGLLMLFGVIISVRIK